jgi:hypothetical protein
MASTLLNFTYFDKVTNEGKIFSTQSVHTAGITLTDIEKQERNKWAKDKLKLELHYRKFLTFERICTKEQLLQMRIAAPVLVVEFASARSSITDRRKKRVYPDVLYEWDEFVAKVKTFSPLEVPEGETEQGTSNPFGLSLVNTTTFSNESKEGFYLKSFVLTPLEEMGLLKYIPNCKPEYVIGQPDGVMIKNSSTKTQVAACVEVKSTQNLLLPDDVDEVIEAYGKALKLQKQSKKRTNGWSRACHPIGQLAGYMVDNKTRYGILTSGTKTYFLFLSGNDDRANRKLQITPAWFIGQENYLKAWACFYEMASGASSLLTSDMPANWDANTPTTTPEEKSDPPGMPPPGGDGDGDDSEHTGKRIRVESQGIGNTRDTKKGKSDQGGGSGKTRAVAALSEMDISSTPPDDDDDDYPENGLSKSKKIPFIKFDSLTDIEPLGWGRNGCTFKATWKGEKVAVKQFDLTKNALAYETELEAYNRLETDWGRLVPTPFFLSESSSGNVRFLGMQLGRPPKDYNVSVDDAYHKVLTTLNNKYGFQQLDWSHCDNCVYLDDGDEDHSNSTLVVIDLENVEFSGDNCL